MKKLFTVILAAALSVSAATQIFADTVLFEDDFDSETVVTNPSDPQYYAPPSNWTTSMPGTENMYVKAIAEGEGNNVMLLYDTVTSGAANLITAEGGFHADAGSALLIKFSTRNNQATRQERISLCQGDKIGIELISVNPDGRALPDGEVIDGEAQAALSGAAYCIQDPLDSRVAAASQPRLGVIPSAANVWFDVEIVANFSAQSVMDVGGGYFRVTMTKRGTNDSFSKKGKIRNAVTAFDKIVFQTPGSMALSGFYADDVSVTQLRLFDPRFENTTAVYDESGGAVTDLSALSPGKITFENRLFNYSRRNKKATVMALLYQDGYLIRTACGEGTIPFCIDEDDPAYEYVNFDMTLEESDVTGELELAVYTWDDLIKMNPMLEIAASTQKVVVNSPVIDPATNILTLSGTTVPSGRVTLQVVRDGAQIPASVGGAELLQTFYALRETVADASGNFEFSVKFSGVDAPYALRINDAAGIVAQQDFYFENDLAKQSLENMRFAETLGEVKTIASDYLDAIRFADALYLRNREEIQASDGFYKVFYNENMENPITDVIRMEKIARAASAMYELGKVPDKAAFVKVMEQHENALVSDDFPARALADDTVVVNGAVKAELYARTAAYAQANPGVLESISRFNDQMSDNLILAVCAKKIGYLAGRAVIAELNRLYGGDSAFLPAYNKYANLSSTPKSVVEESLVGASYNTLSDLKSRFIILAKEAKEVTGSAGDASRGSGSTSVYSGRMAQSSLPDGSAEQNGADPKPIFKDISQVTWAYDSIALLADKNIISGRGEGIFAPDDSVTREEFVKMLVLALQMTSEGAQCDFADVGKDDWSYPYVASAFESGLIKGTDGGGFGAGQPVTREDIAVMIARASEIKGIALNAAATDAFSDETQISDYAKEAVQLLKGAKLLNGYPDGAFAPRASATRAEVAKIIHSLLARVY